VGRGLGRGMALRGRRQPAGRSPAMAATGGRRTCMCDSVRQGRWGHRQVGPGHSNGWRSQNSLNRFKIQTVWKCSNFSKLDRSKFDFPELRKFQIKYGFEDLEKMNNFLQTSLDSEQILCLKYEKLLGLEFNIISSWYFKLGWNLGQGMLVAPSIQPNAWVWIWSSY
jgi:hypothetical protein